ncbi:LysR substrate-binding domain-containing protein [Micromonospora sp. KC606]|uniref:LysR substrate-binding domain-containing protein n=1 Tax=Micromonospora sp. KC606 TaxID=2530379 RepID=UPI001FB7E3DA|nr:LysR substrate-binding domain-containing protein [Micromonospora sp. KC606]
MPTTARPKGVNARELARDRLVAVVAPDHSLAAEQAVSLRRLSSEVFVDLSAKTAGRIQSDQAFAAANLTRDVAFEVTTAYLMSRLVEQGLAVAMLPSAYAPQLTCVTTIKVTDAPARVEYVIWNQFDRTPAANAFLALLDSHANDAGSGA